MRSNKSQFRVQVRLSDTEEIFTLLNCRSKMKIREFKSALELVTGIPIEFQRISYLDQGDLMDESTFRCNDVVPGGTITMTIWPYNGWSELVRAAASGDIYKLRSALLSPSAPFSTQSCVASRNSHRLFSALYISAHRGHTNAVRFLLQNGADVKGQTPLGRGPLHSAACQGHTQCIEELLANGAPLQLQDGDGMTALDVAKRLQVKRQLIKSQWQERTAGVQSQPYLETSELFAHQRFDSHLKTGFRGPRGQRYEANLQRRDGHRGPCSGARPNTSLKAGRGPWR